MARGENAASDGHGDAALGALPALSAPLPAPAFAVHAHAGRPFLGERVILHLHVRRVVCRVRWGPRTIFAARLPGLVVPFARRTRRLSAHLLRTAFVLGGEGGATHAAAEGAPVSARTLLRLIRVAPLPSAGSVRVLGVDAWARRKGRSYGPILVNLETDAVIDLLPDRTAETLARWLQHHPERAIVSRDRAGAYAEGIRQGAPQAIQVADRFHLHTNISAALERYLTRKHAALRPAAQHSPATVGPALDEPPPDAVSPLTSREQPERRARRLARYEEVVALRARGASICTIATQVGLGQRTVKRWLQAGHFPERCRRSERPGRVAPCAAYLRARWAEGCHNATQLWQERRARGYTGCYGSVAALVAPWRGTRYRHRGQIKERRPATVEGSTYTPRQVCWLLLKAPDDLTPDEAAYVTRLYHTCPQVALAAALTKECGTVLRARDVDGLDTWLRRAEASGIKELQGGARSLWLDRQAVEAAVRLAWSNGQVEGQVNKLKTTKRAQYGRSTFDLLRRRVLHAA